MSPVISKRQYDARGTAHTRAPVSGYTHFSVWREVGTGDWYQSHPTDPLGDDVRYDGEVTSVSDFATPAV